MDEPTVKCMWCETPTRSTFSKCCDSCYELSSRIEQSPEMAQRMLAAAGKTANTSVEFNDVKMFFQKFGFMAHDKPVHLTKRKLTERVELMKEELDEFINGCGLLVHEQGNQNLEEQADALVDLVYVALGTAVMLGLPWIELWEDVQRANMAKVRGETHRGHKVDVTKPRDWVGPKTRQILNEAGYDITQFVDPKKSKSKIAIDEEKCLDDQ